MNRGPDDVLAKAFAKSSVKEYHGRVLTAGSGVTKKSYFKKRRERSSDAEFNQMKDKLAKMEQIVTKLLEDKHEMRREDDDMDITPVRRSEKGSCPPSNQIPEGESICDLFVNSPTYAKVGWGLVYREQGQRVHNVIISSHEVRVCLKEVFVGHEKTPLPIKNAAADIYTVEEAKGTYVVWPTSLVSSRNKGFEAPNKNKSVEQSITKCPKKKPVYPRPDDFDPVASRHMCLSYTQSMHCESIPVPMSEPFWNCAFTDHVSIENIQEVLELGWLSATNISIYIRYLCDSLLIHEEGDGHSTSSKYSFTSPQVIKGHTHIVDALQKHANQDHLVIIPFNLEHHWILVAINTMTEHVYYMDPLRVHHSHKDRKQLAFTITSALTAYRATKVDSNGGRSRVVRPIQWYDIVCPKQDLERGYCAYYICLFIEDILESGTTNVPAAYFKKRRCDTFPDDRIEHVQKEWCGYFYNMFLKDKVARRR